MQEDYVDAKKPNKTLGIIGTLSGWLSFIISSALARTYPIPASLLSVIVFGILLGFKINERQMHKGDESYNRKHALNVIIIYSILIVIFGSLLFTRISALGGLEPQNPSIASSIYQSPEALAEQAVRSVKATTTFPKAIDSITNLTGIISNGNTVEYLYQLHDADTSSLTSAALESSIKPEVCSKTEIKPLLSHGVNLEYNYSVLDSAQTFDFTVTSADCV